LKVFGAIGCPFFNCQSKFVLSGFRGHPTFGGHSAESLDRALFAIRSYTISLSKNNEAYDTYGKEVKDASSISRAALPTKMVLCFRNGTMESSP
jgi:hypothetical protein